VYAPVRAEVSSLVSLRDFLYKNEKIRKKMSQNALNTVKKINGWDQYGKNWYKKLNFLSKKIKYKSENQYK